ncbi:hypothetical protein [Nocardioides sp. zg-1230]|uniref:hypothetical protein n=1 Tax=Nocardioides sp. zg-1230 TaxID=2736601 RepID=UPI001552B481|nr:hypothetical protein [Nocardioides sp. zg-1230]NPC41033.1 hypothetical protein [Nocardioides sp. zg-1230]
MLAVDAAEAAGDPVKALALVEGMLHGPDGRPWWRPQRVRRLRQLVALGDAAPGWAWGRWVVAQAAQPRPGRDTDAADVAIDVRGGRSTLWGMDPSDALAKVIDHDWVFRQLILHERGGLDHFLRRVAAPHLLDLASEVHSWVGAPLGAYELVSERADRIVWRDLGVGTTVETLNLGGASMMALGEAVVGRVVHAGEGSLFESAPLCVPLNVAHDVAARPADWLDALSRGCRGEAGRVLTELIAKANDFDLLFDLSSRMRRHLLQPVDPDLRSDSVGAGGNGVAYDVAVVLAALSGDLSLSGDDADHVWSDVDAVRPLAPLVSAALMEPETHAAIEPLLLTSDAPAISRLADALVSPADVFCRQIGDQLTSAA